MYSLGPDVCVWCPVVKTILFRNHHVRRSCETRILREFWDFLFLFLESESPNTKLRSRFFKNLYGWGGLCVGGQGWYGHVSQVTVYLLVSCWQDSDVTRSSTSGCWHGLGVDLCRMENRPVLIEYELSKGPVPLKCYFLPIPICRGQKSGVMIFVSLFSIVKI